jgi:uncharacterized protein (DUF305 family)
MQIKVDKKTALLLSVIGVLAFSIALLSISLLANKTDHDHSSMMDGMNHSSAGKVLSSSDAMFLQMMIPHHEQAVVMSDLAMKISKNSELLALAAQIKAAQSPEIVQMKKWLADDGLGENPGHSMDSMGGMLSKEDLKELSNSSGTSFDKRFISGMIDHHIGAVDMAKMIQDSKVADLRAFADAITKTQSAEIELMRKLLAKI